MSTATGRLKKAGGGALEVSPGQSSMGTSGSRAKIDGTPLKPGMREALLDDLRKGVPHELPGGAQARETETISILTRLSEQMKAQDAKIDKLVTTQRMDDKIKELEAHMTSKTATMITEQVMPVREELDGLQKKFEEMEANGLSGESLSRIEKLEKMYGQLKKDSDIIEQQKCSKIMVIGGWTGSDSQKDRFTTMDKLVKDLKITDKVVQKGCHHFSKAKGGGLATVTFIEFTTKTARDIFFFFLRGALINNS